MAFSTVRRAISIGGLLPPMIYAIMPHLLRHASPASCHSRHMFYHASDAAQSMIIRTGHEPLFSSVIFLTRLVRFATVQSFSLCTIILINYRYSRCT